MAAGRKLEPELQTIIDQARDGQLEQARARSNTYLLRYPDDVDGWWLAHNIADEPAERLRTARRTLELAPDHPYATKFIEAAQAQAQQRLIQKERLAQRGRRTRSRPRRVVTLLGLLLLTLTGAFFTLLVTGNDLGLVGKNGGLNEVLYLSPRAPTIRIGALMPGAVHEYRFTAGANTAVLFNVSFPLGQKSPDRAVKFFGPDNSLLSYGSKSTTNLTSLNYFIQTSGQYRIQITGIAGTSQGLYLLQGAASLVDIPTTGR